MSGHAIELSGLSKRYGELWALRNVSLTIEEGDTFGFIGPNGAGKTTTIKILSTLLAPTAGSASIAGLDVCSQYEEVRRVIGYMPDYFGIYDDLRVWEYLDFFAAAYGIDARRRRSIIDGVLELTDLTGKRGALVDSLSRGMKQRLCLAKTLVHDPKVLLLDEPASGLDPRARIEIRELLKELSSMGKTIFISSHILTELAELCNKVGIVEEGRLVAQGSVGELAARVAPHNLLRLEVLGAGADVPPLLASFERVGVESVGERELMIRFDGPEEDIPDLITRILEKGVRLVGFSREDTGLERIFMEMTEGVVS